MSDLADLSEQLDCHRDQAAAMEDVVDGLFAQLEPPPQPRSLREFAASLRIPDEKGVPHPFDSGGFPAQEHVLDAIGADRYMRVSVIGDTQDGKTLVTIIIPLLWVLCELREPCVLSQPDENMLVETWSEKIVPIIESSGLAHMLPSSGLGSEGGITKAGAIRMNGGGTLFMIGGGARNESAQASRTARWIFQDETDSNKPRILRLVERRSDSYDERARIISTSTIKKDDPGQSAIINAYERTPQGRLEYTMPCCGHQQQFTQQCFNSDPTSDVTAKESARIACMGCGTLHDEDARQSIIIDQYQFVENANSDALSWGLRFTALDSPRKSLMKTALLYREAVVDAEKLEYSAMQNFIRDQMCEQWQHPDDAEKPAQITRKWLEFKSRSSNFGPVADYREHERFSHHEAQPPPTTRYMTFAVDVQSGGARAPGRLYYLMQGFDKDGQTSYACAYGFEIISPQGRHASESELHAGLEMVDKYLTDLADSWGIPIVARGCDVGDRQEELVRWLNKKSNWTAVRGSDKPMKVDAKYSVTNGRYRKSKAYCDMEGIIYFRRQPKWWLAMVDVGAVRSTLQRKMLLAADVPGTFAVPQGMLSTDTLCRHLCATVLIPDDRGGVRWSNRASDREHHPEYQVRKDLLDCAEYSWALGQHYEHFDAVGSARIPAPAYQRQYGVIRDGGL